MQSKSIANTQNIIYSWDLFTRELRALTAFVKNIEPVASNSTYEPGTDLIRDSYFEEYQRRTGKPDAAASQKTAFSPVDFDGVIYWLGH